MSWSVISVGSLVERGEAEVKTGPFGTQLKASDYVEQGTPVINVRNIGFGSIRPDKLEYIPEEVVKRLSGHLLRKGDIVFGRKGAVERHVYIQSGQDRWFQGSDCLRLRIVSQESVLSKYLSFTFLTHEHQSWMMQQCSHGATMASLNQDIIKRISVKLPPIEKQRMIVDILSAYDDLIENNTRRIEILEEMARRLYEEWFVHFRFPGHEGVCFKESELGEIPEGWEVSRLESFGTIHTGKTPSKKKPELFGSEVPFIKLPDMHDQIFITETNEALSKEGEETQRKKTVPANSICVSCIGTGGIVVITSEPSQTNQQINTVVPTRSDLREFLYFSALSLRDDINNYGATGATMTNLSRGKFASLKIIAPCEELVSSYNKLTAPMFDRILNLQRANRNLRAQQNLLLPKLVFGEIDVFNISMPNNKEVEAA